MQAARLFLLQTHTQDAAILDPLAEFLRQAGRDVSRILVPPEVLDGTDQAAIATLSQLRDASGAVTTDASRPKTILIAFGISASFALWMNILDLTKPKKTRIRSSTVIHPDVIEQPPVLDGVIAASPFLGFDFLRNSAVLGTDRFSEWRLAQSRGALAGLLGGFRVQRPREHGCWGEFGPIRWDELAKRLAYASVAKTLPSLKRPTVLILDSGDMADRTEVQLCALSGKVGVMDSPMTMPEVGHVTLVAVDWILKGPGQT